MAKSCCCYPESKGAATTKPLSHGARKFPHWSSVLGEFKPWDSGVTAIMAHHAPLPIDISIASSVRAQSVLVARASSVSFDLFFSLVASAFTHPLLQTPSTTVPSRTDAPPMALLLSLSLCRALTSTTSLSECASIAESCNHDLVHPYRDNDRSPDHGSWYLWLLRRDVEVVKLLILNEKSARNCSPRITPHPQGFAGFWMSISIDIR